MAVETWLPWCERVDGPEWKQGYDTAARRTLSNIKGEVKHSAEGGFTSLLAALQHPTRQASWTFSISKQGRVVQHYPLEFITWHCGDFAGNRDYVGSEHEGVAGDPLTTEQILATVHISLDIRRLAGITAPPAIRVNLWEHNWISSTTCPSKRIPWGAIIVKINNEEGTAMDAIDQVEDWIGDGKHRTLGQLLRHLNRGVELRREGVQHNTDAIERVDTKIVDHVKNHPTGSTNDGCYTHLTSS